MNLKCCYKKLSLLIVVLLLGQQAFAQGFGAGISPSRFELRAKPGAVLRDTIMVVNPGNQPASYQFTTSDWEMNANQGPDFYENELADDSCRPWVKLERKTVEIRPGARKNYRFEVHVPEDAEPGLCKFALLISPADTATAAMGGAEQQIRFPVVGRYAAMVYVTIGDAKADIEFLGIQGSEKGELRLPVLVLKNNGNTLDRTFGQISATDADGQRVMLVPNNFPVLPGRTEAILLSPEQPRNREPVAFTFNYPLKLKGQFEIGGRKFKVDESFN